MSIREEIGEPIGKIPAVPLNLVPEAKHLEAFDSRLGGEGVAEAAGGPIAEEDESVVVSVGDRSPVLAIFTEPFYRAVGTEDAIGERKLGAGWVDEIVEWNGEGSDGGIVAEIEGTGGPALSFATVGRRAIVWDI